jgi:hypothetical protein
MLRGGFSRSGIVLLALVCLAGTPTRALGQEAERARTVAQRSPTEFVNRRELNGHTYMPSRHIGQPFIAGWLRGLFGGAFATGLRVPVLGGSGDTSRVVEGQMSALLLDAEYQQRFGEWLAVRLGATGAARVGIDAPAAIAQGAEAQFGVNLGTTVKLVRSEQVALSAVGDARFNQAYAYNLVRFIEQILEGGLEGASLLDSGWTNTYTAGLRLAWSPSKWFGFALFGEGGLGTPFLEDQGNSGVVGLGVSGEYDLGAGTSVPLGFQAFFRWDNFSDLYPELSNEIWRAGIVVGYTGAADFYTGIEAGFTSIGLRDDVPAAAEGSSLDTFSAGLVMRYYF